MANTTIDPVDLPTLITQINHFTQTTGGEANGVAAANQPREPDRWEEMIQRVVALRSLGKDWDGLGAKAPQASLIESALELAQNLRRHGFRSPSRVGAGPDGEILLEWQDERIYLE